VHKTNKPVHLYKKIGTKDENLIFSPFSITSALAVTYAGARGNTASEMSSVLYFPEEQALLHQAFDAINDSIMLTDNEKGTTLNIANGLWVQEGYSLKEEFIDLAEEDYLATVEQVRFDTPSDQEKSRQQINKWVEKKTENKILELIPPGVLNALSRLVITNAIYFNGNWEHPFEESKTTPSLFHVSSKKSVSTPFMHQKEVIKYYEDDEVQAIELNYKGEKSSMVILLPKETEGWKLIGNILTIDRLEIILSGFEFKEIDMAIPSFTYESSYNLKEKLMEMGMEISFSMEADFSGMTGEKDLKIDEVLHKAFVEVNESGTEAAASTAVIMALKSAYETKINRFIADHPFFFFILDKSSGSILFMGRFIHPAEN